MRPRFASCFRSFGANHRPAIHWLYAATACFCPILNGNSPSGRIIPLAETGLFSRSLPQYGQRSVETLSSRSTMAAQALHWTSDDRPVIVSDWRLAVAQYSSQLRSRTDSDVGSIASAYPQYGHLSSRCDGLKSSLAPQPGHGNLRPVPDSSFAPASASSGAWRGGSSSVWKMDASGGTFDTAVF